MNDSKPLDKPKSDYLDIIDRIKSDSAVGIDAQFTHAIIIEYLKQISNRLEKIENEIQSKEL